MVELKPCPKCGVPPKIGYACGEYLVYGDDPDCPYCGHDFTEMHSSEKLEVEAWNRRVEMICGNCLHRAVCGKYAATGGVNKCRDHKEERHGRWKGAGMGDYLCSICWCVYSGGNRFKHCPNCGAQMIGDGDDG